MTVLLTGGSGFLGSHIAEQLAESDVPVRALVRRSSDTRLLSGLRNVELVTAALDDPKSLDAALDGVTRVIHSAGLVKARSAAEFHRVNSAGAINLLEAAKRQGGIERFVLVSSLAAVGPTTDGRAAPADAPPQPVTHYGRSKLAAERAAIALRNEVPITIIRPPVIYGPRDREVFAFFQSVKFGVLPYMGSTARGISIIFASDCAAACVRALDAEVPSGSIYFVDDGETQTLAELIAHIEVAMAKRAWVRFPVPRRVLATVALGIEAFGKVTNRAVMLTRDKCNELYAPHWVSDSTDARRDLGWESKVPFDRGARITAEWYRREGWL
jgi:nucleoside-diphosphate-sugar epimerase